MIDKGKFHNLPFSACCSLEENFMKLPRRQFLHLAAGAVVLPTFSRDAEAQAYPTRPITLIVPFAAGGIYSAVGRAVAERMKEALGQPIIIENVGGGDGSIGAGRAAHARPDGYTIVLGSMATHVLNGAFYSLQYDLLNDFAPIAAVAASPNILVAKKSMPGGT
jgi:tripartite-type tricarboxylate transporter receptor subunit TctC